MKKSLEKRGQEEVPAEIQAELCAWQQEQEGELNTLRAHCQGRHKQLEDILIKLNRSGSLITVCRLIILYNKKNALKCIL